MDDMTKTLVRQLWQKHNGYQHGPRVEQMCIPEANFDAFIADLIAAYAPSTKERTNER